jgi:hypothetical protein
MIKVNMKTLAMALSLSTFTLSANANSVLAPDQIKLKVSATEYSIIDIQGRDLNFADCESTHCRIESSRSGQIGKVVFKPVSDEPFVMFVTDSRGQTHALHITPDKNTAPNVYTIKPVSLETPPPTAEEVMNLRRLNSALNTNEGRTKAIIDLVKSMSEGVVPSNVNTRLVQQPIPLWEEVDFFHKADYYTGNLVGSKFYLKNKTSSRLNMIESEFYPLNENVVAVAIENKSLPAGEHTVIYIVTHAK